MRKFFKKLIGEFDDFLNRKCSIAIEHSSDHG